MPYADETNLQRIADDIKGNIVNDLTTDSSTKFLSAAMGKVLHDSQLITFSGTALVSGTWTNGVLTLSLPDSGLLSTDVPFIDYYPYEGYSTIDNFDAYCLVTYIEVGNDTLTFHALGDEPEVPFGIQYKVVR